MADALQERTEPPVAAPAADGTSERPRRGPVRAALKAMRPQEWVKNLLVFAGLLFSAKFKDFDAVVDASVTFAAFCMVASAGYLVNDAHDVAEDRQHPTKRFRPIAAGELRIPT
ncbi:MAG: UbiA family prenyltransferase, partial [Solirubrobacterales bacterium]